MLLDVSASLQMRPLAEERAGTVLGQPLPAPLDSDDAVENEEDLVPAVSLVEQDRAGREALDPALAATLHQLRRQGCLERRLNGGYQRIGVLVAPRTVFAERLAVPSLKSVSPDLWERAWSAP